MKKNNIIEVLKLTDEELDKKIKIAGTDYDRKRKVTKQILKQLKTLERKGKSYSEIAQIMGLSYHAVKYNLNDEFRFVYNATRDNRHVGKDHITDKNRVIYKRNLVAQGLLG